MQLMIEKYMLFVSRYIYILVLFSDNELRPYSLYEYAVTVVNSAGAVKSNFTTIKTLQARPEGLESPEAILDPRQLYLIFLRWKPPSRPNGRLIILFKLPM